MAFSTFGALRTRLNSRLGLASDADDQPFGDSDVRDDALMDAFSQLWPTMALLQREAVTIVTDQLDYTLSTLEEVQAVEIIDSTSGLVAGAIKSWRVVKDGSTQPETINIRFEALPASTTASLRIVGYAPYTSTFASDGASLDIPPRLEWIVLLGAQAYLYRRKLNERLNFQLHAVQGRENDTTVQEIIGAYQLVKREFEDAIAANRREFVAARADRIGRP